MLIRPGDFDNRVRLALLWSEGDKESGRGTGKTALLRHFQHRINQDWGATEFKHFSAAVIYVCFPDRVDRQFSEQMAWAGLLDAHDSGLVRAAAANLRLREIEQHWPEQYSAVITALQEYEAAGRDGVDILFDKEVLQGRGLVAEDVHGAAVERLVDADVRGPLADAFAADTLEPYFDGQVRPYYVQRDMKGLTQAKQILFDDFVRFLREAGFPGCYLFVDDIENLTDQMSNKETIEFSKELALCLVRPGRAAGDLRFFSCVLTTHQQAATRLARGWGEAGLQAFVRLDPSAETSIKVPLPTEDGALEMLAEYIKHHRLPGHEGLDTLHPFTEASARRLVSGVKPALHPRSFLQKAHFAVRKAVDAKASKIDVADVEALFAETGTTSTPSVGSGEPDKFDVY